MGLVACTGRRWNLRYLTMRSASYVRSRHGWSEKWLLQILTKVLVRIQVRRLAYDNAKLSVSYTPSLSPAKHRARCSPSKGTVIFRPVKELLCLTLSFWAKCLNMSTVLRFEMGVSMLCSLFDKCLLMRAWFSSYASCSSSTFCSS